MINAAYFIGAGGIGMSALVRYFLSKGLVVGGYDRTSCELTEELRAEDFAGKGRVGLTAGASTPRKLIDATQQWLEQLPD